ncbi:ATP-binding protein [Geosporobacter ferrireducens]|uniref:histidine kinase n=1 Tax=Geosporobacter ferrireducens TaxID=1424294 RepID=A0A1D8GE47_9FIRM|nr:ATP-binding protein [Geosporobacter ferrireducens]AOT69183.1 hypothetical protein Gferi_06160 [Geosporobacter ferrireducens]MTI56860.1 histidine kinase [Geosporobacter ferrireducens]
MKSFIRRFAYEIIIFILMTAVSIIHFYAIDFSGKPFHNFYRLLYTIPILLAAFKYGFKGGVITPIITGLIYSPHILLSTGIGSQTYNELLDITLFFVVGIITGTLVEKRNIRLMKLENQLKQYVLLEEYTNGIIESIKLGVIVVNNDMLITIINQGAKEVLNINEDYLGKDLHEVFICCDRIKEKIKTAIHQNHIIENNEFVVKKEEEKELNIKVSVFPLTFQDISKGAVITVDDITEMKKLQYHIQRNDKLAALGELSTGVAHEIRNPLAIIKAVGQTMKSEIQDNKEALKELEIIDEEVERANKIVTTLMKFAKPNKNIMEYCMINNVIDDILMIMNKYIVQNEVSIVFNRMADSQEIKVDKELLKQAFMNIIFNGVDAMARGGILKIATENLENKWIKIRFEDTGMGIEEKHLEKIFNPFFTTKDEGTGLGLSIVHRIIEDHNGLINVSSKAGQGTIFEILLPAGEGVGSNR